MIKKLFKKFWNYGNDYTLGLGKELFLGLLIFLGIWFVNFGFCQEMTSFDCQTEYNLIPISSINSNYCDINGLCSLSSESVSGTSSIYVLSKGKYYNLTGTYNYFINLPDYLDYSFVYSNGGNDLDLDLVINYDTGYISSIISTQSTLPNQVDLNNLVSGVLPLFVPGLVIILFIYFTFKFIKKIF